MSAEMHEKKRKFVDWDSGDPHSRDYEFHPVSQSEGTIDLLDDGKCVLDLYFELFFSSCHLCPILLAFFRAKENVFGNGVQFIRLGTFRVFDGC
jgi:hypothetical protein